jgi:hypothetical protein
MQNLCCQTLKDEPTNRRTTSTTKKIVLSTEYSVVLRSKRKQNINKRTQEMTILPLHFTTPKWKRGFYSNSSSNLSSILFEDDAWNFGNNKVHHFVIYCIGLVSIFQKSCRRQNKKNQLSWNPSKTFQSKWNHKMNKR